MSADRDRGIRRQTQKRAKDKKRELRQQKSAATPAKQAAA
jgi:hypothetical protein